MFETAVELSASNDARRVLVVGSGNPELDHLATALAGAGLLARYLNRYVNKGRRWERLLAATPAVGPLFRRTLGRRRMPAGLETELVSSAGLAADFASALVRRTGLIAGSTRGTLEHDWLQRRDLSISRAAASRAAGVRLVVGNYGVGLHAFRRIKQEGRLAVLNYPIAHHRYAERLLQEDAQLEPEFASTLTGHVHSDQLVARYDQEIELADRILVGSTFVRDSFVAEGVAADKLIVVPYGANVQLFAPPTERGRDGRFRVLFVGQIGQRKGIAYLLHAYQRFRGPDTSLTLVGNFARDPRVFEPYRNLFRHIPHIPQPSLRALYQESDVFVFPTLIEGMPMVVLEAMASGLPVIVTSHGPGDIVRDGIEGFVVPIRDPEAIAERMDFLRSNPDVRAEMGIRARERALEYTWSAYETRVLHVLEEVLHS